VGGGARRRGASTGGGGAPCILLRWASDGPQRIALWGDGHTMPWPLRLTLTDAAKLVSPHIHTHTHTAHELGRERDPATRADQARWRVRAHANIDGRLAGCVALGQRERCLGTPDACASVCMFVWVRGWVCVGMSTTRAHISRIATVRCGPAPARTDKLKCGVSVNHTSNVMHAHRHCTVKQARCPLSLSLRHTHIRPLLRVRALMAMYRHTRT
jgi:hypothetical protein